MSATLSRRQFTGRLAGVAGAVLLGAGGSWALAAPGGDANEFAFPLLGDLHFDHLEHHDLEWLRKTHPNDVTQVQNYARISREVTPQLLNVVRQQEAQSKAPVPFVLQLGDLIEGLCGTEKLADRQAREALDLVRKVKFAA